MMKLRNILTGVLMLVGLAMFAQQEQQYTMYFVNPYTINPALAGTEDFIDIKLGGRYQWMGIEAAPKTIYLTAHSTLGKEFKPEYAGKMNFYLSVVDDLVKHESDQPSIGLILCKTKSNVLAEYALRDMTKPIGLAEYRLEDALPDKIKTSLPTIKELEAELKKDFPEDNKK